LVTAPLGQANPRQTSLTLPSQLRLVMDQPDVSGRGISIGGID
jgi:hypothetical protein